MQTSNSCLCGDPLCGRCFGVEISEVVANAAELEQLRIIATRAELLLSYLEPGSLIDQAKDPQLRIARDLAELLLRDSINYWKGE